MRRLDGQTKIYFISDAHLGIDGERTSDERERIIVAWLDSLRADATEVMLVGDMFDFWFEYKYVVPRGFNRLIVKLRELTDAGIKVTFFGGNHDMWMFDYLPLVTGAEIVHGPLLRQVNGKTLYIAHGDGLGNFDRKYNFLKRCFASRLLQGMFRMLHPRISFGIARAWSAGSRKKHRLPPVVDYDKEWSVLFARDLLQTTQVDFFIFGHRHIPYQHRLTASCTLTNLGDCLTNFTYACFDGKTVELKKMNTNI